MVSRICKRVLRETIIESISSSKFDQKLNSNKKTEASILQENRIDKITRNFLNLIEKENKENTFFFEKVILPKLEEYFKVANFSNEDFETFKNINKVSLLFSISHSIGSKVLLYIDLIF